MGLLDSLLQEVKMMKVVLVVLLVVCGTVLAMRKPPYECADGSKADCKRGRNGNGPSCTCADNSTPVVKPPCADGTFPTCPAGSCPDGSAAVPSGDPINSPPCGKDSDGKYVRPVRSEARKCACADGTSLRGWLRGGL